MTVPRVTEYTFKLRREFYTLPAAQWNHKSAGHDQWRVPPYCSATHTELKPPPNDNLQRNETNRTMMMVFINWCSHTFVLLEAKQCCVACVANFRKKFLGKSMVRSSINAYLMKLRETRKEDEESTSEGIPEEVQWVFIELAYSRINWITAPTNRMISLSYSKIFFKPSTPYTIKLHGPINIITSEGGGLKELAIG